MCPACGRTVDAARIDVRVAHRCGRLDAAPGARPLVPDAVAVGQCGSAGPPVPGTASWLKEECEKTTAGLVIGINDEVGGGGGTERDRGTSMIQHGHLAAGPSSGRALGLASGMPSGNDTGVQKAGRPMLHATACTSSGLIDFGQADRMTK